MFVWGEEYSVFGKILWRGKERFGGRLKGRRKVGFLSL
jgi:hypothetical protein